MHERNIASGIIKQAETLGKVKSIIVEVGDLAHLPASEMKQVLEEMTDWKIIVQRKKAIAKCACGYEGEPNIVEHGHDYTFFKCPRCEDIPEVIEGKDIILKEVDVE